MSTFTYYDHDETVGRMRMAEVGRWVDPVNPDPTTLRLEDIARSLSRLCRFGGHIAGAGIYSVAEHSLHCAAQLWRQFGDPMLSLCGLMHDATEAYLGDVIRPVKRNLPEYVELERNMAEAIRQRFQLPDNLAQMPDSVVRIWHLVKKADEEILPWEMAMYRDCPWRTPNPPEVVEVAFGKAYDRYAHAAFPRRYVTVDDALQIQQVQHQLGYKVAPVMIQHELGHCLDVDDVTP